jgi:integrase
MRERHHKVAADVARGRYRKLKNAEPPSGKATANGLFRVLRAVYNRACREHEELPTGIFMSVDWFPDVRRKAPIGAEGLADLHARIASVKNATRRDLWRLMLFTGLRRGSACSVRWEDVDLARKVLRVPNPKGGEARAFDLPLSEHLVSMLDARRKAHAKLVADVDKMQPWVFPADSESGHIEEPRDDALGITPHDCRRLFLSVAGGMEGVSPYAIKLLVNHALPGADVTAGYMSIAEDDVRRAMELITARMLALCKVKTKRRVAS